AFAGYITDDGPSAPPDENSWQHPSWSARKTQQEAFASLEADKPQLATQLYDEIKRLFFTMEKVMDPAFESMRFVQVNFHSQPFFLWEVADGWQVSGCIDMEVASAGCTLYDLVGFGIQMAAFFPPDTEWWQPFFQGYGAEPDFDRFRLLMLGNPEICF